MAVFKFDGIINDGMTTVGTVVSGNETYKVGVSLVRGMGKPRIKALEDELRSRMLRPDILLEDTGEVSLASSFTTIGGQKTLSVPVKSGEQAVFTVAPVLETDYRTILFLCADEEAYLATCTELSMSRRDFFRVAELKSMLENNEEHTDTPVGSAQRLISTLKRGKVNAPFLGPDGRFSKGGIGRTVESMTDAVKILAGDDKWDPKNDDFLFYPGDHRLPFSNCLFEYRYEGLDPVTKEVMPMITYLHAMDNGVLYHAKLYDYNVKKKLFTNLGFGPSWKVDDAGRVIDEEFHVNVLDRGVEDFYSQSYDPWTGQTIPPDSMHRRSYSALRRIGATLAALNEPRANIVSSIPSPKLLRNQGGTVPFFKYIQVEVDRPLDDEGSPIYGSAVHGRKPFALHKVRGHLKPSIDKWISDYVRGDARFGVIQKSFADSNPKDYG